MCSKLLRGVTDPFLYSGLTEEKQKNGRGEWRREEEEGGSCSVGRSVG